MSTDMQEHSIANQRAVLSSYASSHGMAIVRSYADEGRSGLRLSGRPAMQRLLADVRTGASEIEAILVLDVSRWGRFQDPDESAYHEFVCAARGVPVVYVAEPFDEEKGPLGTVLKSLKRHLATEFSRELSARVTAGQRRLAGMGLHMGAAAAYAYRRLVVDSQGRPKGYLAKGECKGLLSDRVVLVPGDASEVAIVRDAFRWAAQGLSTAGIALRLNASGRLRRDGSGWTYRNLRYMLKNPLYTGQCRYGRLSKRLGQRDTLQAKDTWIAVDGAYPGIISRSLFARAVATLAANRRGRRSNDEALQDVREVLARKGRLSLRLLDREAGVLGSHALMKRFGGLSQVYEMVGYSGPRDMGYCVARRAMRPWSESILGYLTERMEDAGSTVVRQGNVLQVDGCWSFTVSLSRLRRGKDYPRGAIRAPTEAVDIVVVARMRPDGLRPIDYLIVPRHVLTSSAVLTAYQQQRGFWPWIRSSLQPVVDLAVISRGGVEVDGGTGELITPPAVELGRFDESWGRRGVDIGWKTARYLLDKPALRVLALRHRAESLLANLVAQVDGSTDPYYAHLQALVWQRCLRRMRGTEAYKGTAADEWLHVLDAALNAIRGPN